MAGNLWAVRRLITVLTACVLTLLFAAGCGSSGAPTSYADQDGAVRDHYVEGCRIGFEETDDANLVAGAQSVCECAFDEISASITFEEFEDLDKRLKEDLSILQQSPLPQGSTEALVKQIVADCIRAA